MRGLSFSQPWLWAILHANKRIENRPWAPPIEMIGQQIALHAAKSFDADGSLFLGRLGFDDRPTAYDKSAIVGVATIDRVITEWRIGTHADVAKLYPTDQERWFFGPFGWILSDVRAIERPIPWDGALGLWTVPPIIEHLIQHQLRGEYTANYKPAYVSALASAGVESATEWADKHTGEHLWFEYDGLPSCVCCGKVRRRDTAKRSIKPCCGVVSIGLRTEAGNA